MRLINNETYKKSSSTYHIHSVRGGDRENCSNYRPTVYEAVCWCATEITSEMSLASRQKKKSNVSRNMCYGQFNIYKQCIDPTSKHKITNISAL